MKLSKKCDVAVANLRRNLLKVQAVSKSRWTVSNAAGAIVLENATMSEFIHYGSESAKQSIHAEWNSQNPLGGQQLTS